MGYGGKNRPIIQVDDPQFKQEVNAQLAENASGLSFSKTKNMQTSVYGTSEPIFLDNIGDGHIYGKISSTLYRKQKLSDSWTLIKNIPSGDAITGIRKLGDGEVIVACASAGLWKSNGWESNPTSATFSQVLVTNGAVRQFTFDVDKVSGWVSATCYISDGDMSNSRYVWLSKDNGNTFNVIFDLEQKEPTINNYHAHFHIAILDPYHNQSTPRIWISYHKTNADPTELTAPIKRIKYSDDGGVTWVDFSNENYQPEAAIATPEGVYFSSDEDVVGVYFVERKTNPANMKYELIYSMRGSLPGIFALGTKMIRDGEITHIAFRSLVNNYPAYVISAQGRNIAETIRINPATTSDQVNLVDIVAFENKIVGTYYNTSSGGINPYKLIADKPTRGITTFDPNIGGLHGGHARGGAVSGGFNSFSDMRGLAVGHETQAKRDGVSLGYKASSEIEGVAIGKDAKVTVNGVSNGYQANAEEGVSSGRQAASVGDGVSIGPSADSSDESVAIGSFSEGTGTQSVAVGKIAKATGLNSVSVGQQSQATKTGSVALGRGAKSIHDHAVVFGWGTQSTLANQFNIGSRHIEGKNVSNPSSLPTGGFRLYSRLNSTTGKTELCVLFPTGSPIVIATEQ
jgi:hypothetical protein